MNVNTKQNILATNAKEKLSIFIIFYIVIFCLCNLYCQEKEQEWATTTFLLLSSIIANLFLYQTYQKTVSDKPFWLFLFLSLLTFFIGKILLIFSQSILNLSSLKDYTDPLYMCSLFLTIMAFIAILWRKRSVYTCFKLVIDFILLVVVVYSISHQYISSYFDLYSHLLPISFPVYLAYIISYLGIIVGILTFHSKTIWFTKSVLNLFFLLFTLFIISDIAYIFLLVNHFNGLICWVYLLWGTSRLLLALVAVLHLETVATRNIKDSAAKLTLDLLPLSTSYLFIICLIVILLVELGEINSLSIGILFCIIMLGIRQVLSFLENKKLLYSLEEKHIILQNMAYTDYLTSLPNRFQFLHDLHHIKSPCLAIINVENFRAINEFYGYQVGDILIQGLAEKIVKLAKPYGYHVYRLSGDEYAILEDSNNSLLTKWVLSIYDHIEETDFQILGQVHHLFVTFGIAATRHNPLEKAQMALQYARQHHLRIQVYSDELPIKDDYQNNLYWLQETQDAIREDRVMVHYQPIVDVTTGIVAKYEALMRIQSRNGDIISPTIFLPIIKKTKVYPRLTEIVIKKTFAYFSDKNLGFSINLSATDIADEKVKALIMELLATSDFAHRVIFEFVESEEFENPYELSGFVMAVKKYNVKIAIDDFGSGYSNFAYILTMGADYIKIDGSLIKEIVTNSSILVIVESIIFFAKQLGIKTIAEFVSSEEIYNMAKNIGIDECQGYYIGEPAPTVIARGESSYGAGGVTRP